MSAPFSVLPYPYAPKWKKNRDRPEAEQFRVILRPASYNKITGFSADWEATENKDSKASLDKVQNLLESLVQKIENFTVATESHPEGEAVTEVKMLYDLPGMTELIGELLQRILRGMDEDEEKNSE